MRKIEVLAPKYLLVNRETGEIGGDAGIAINQQYNTPMSLNAKVKIMTIGRRMAHICRGSKDVSLFWYIMDILDDNNTFRNLSELAKQTGWDYSTMMKFIKRGIDAGAWKRIKRGEYIVNPYMFKGKRVTNKKCIELQREHPEWYLPEDI